MKKKNILREKIKKILDEEKIVYIGEVRKLNPLLIQDTVKKGSTILTPKGIGVVVSHWPNWWINKPGERVEVKLARSVRTFRIRDTKQLAVYHKPSKQYMLLSPHCHNHIGEENQIIRYRITKRNFAMLTDACKDEYEIYESINKLRGGHQVLTTIRKRGFILKQKDITIRDLYNAFGISVKKKIDHIISMNAKYSYNEKIKNIVLQGLKVVKSNKSKS